MEIIKHEAPQLPVALEDLAQFVLVGRDKLNMVRAGIKALDKLDVAEGVRQQKREEAAMLAEALLDAEVRIGEILKGMPRDKGGRPSEKTINTTVNSFTPKLEAAKELGFTPIQVSRFQTLAENKDIVEQIKQEAREADDLPTRTAVLQAVKIRDRQNDIAKQKQDIETGVLPTLSGKYSVISIDPPWPYGREYDPDGSRAANPYPEMSIADITAIELPLEKDAVIFLWTTHAFDILATKDKTRIIAIDVKTKARLNKWEAQGIDRRMYIEYCYFSEKHNIPFYLVFVDDKNGDIHAVNIAKLHNPINVNDYIIAWPLSQMKLIGKIDEMKIKELSQFDTRTWHYSPNNQLTLY